MAEFGDLIGAKIVIHSEKTGDVLAETTIIDYDKLKRVIAVNGRCLPGIETQRVNMLIISSRHMITCAGIARRQSEGGRWDIPLYRVQVKENRNSVRHTVTAPAKITALKMANQWMPMEEPLAVSVVNISTSGILISSEAPTLRVGIGCRIALGIDGKDTVINSIVVRERKDEEGRRQLGCSFHSLEET